MTNKQELIYDEVGTISKEVYEKFKKVVLVDFTGRIKTHSNRVGLIDWQKYLTKKNKCVEPKNK